MVNKINVALIRRYILEIVQNEAFVIIIFLFFFSVLL